jgi:hypothetical protein
MDMRAYQPAMSDLAVIAKTGRSWSQWFRLLDRSGATRMDHKSIVKLLAARHGIGPWWRQMVTVEYERARGLRVRNQNALGYSVSISRTLGADVRRVYAATSELRTRRKWFPIGRLKITSRTENKYLRGAWNGEGRIEINYFDKGGGKAQVVVQVSRLSHEEDVERERSAWKRALLKLDSMLIRAAA